MPYSLQTNRSLVCQKDRLVPLSEYIYYNWIPFKHSTNKTILYTFWDDAIQVRTNVFSFTFFTFTYFPFSPGLFSPFTRADCILHLFLRWNCCALLPDGCGQIWRETAGTMCWLQRPCSAAVSSHDGGGKQGNSECSSSSGCWQRLPHDVMLMIHAPVAYYTPVPNFKCYLNNYHSIWSVHTMPVLAN